MASALRLTILGRDPSMPSVPSGPPASLTPPAVSGAAAPAASDPPSPAGTAELLTAIDAPGHEPARAALLGQVVQRAAAPQTSDGSKLVSTLAAVLGNKSLDRPSPEQQIAARLTKLEEKIADLRQARRELDMSLTQQLASIDRELSSATSTVSSRRSEVFSVETGLAQSKAERFASAVGRAESSEQIDAAVEAMVSH